MLIARITAAIILVIMAATWGIISYRLLEMQPIPIWAMTVGGTLLSVVTGGEFVAKKFLLGGSK